MIDIRVLRDDPDAVKAALARRGVEAAEVDAVFAADAAWRAQVASAEAMRAEVKDLSRQVGQAKKAGDEAKAAELSARSRQLGEEAGAAAAEADVLSEQVRTGLLYLPNLPAEDAPDGLGEADNVEVRRWWPGRKPGGRSPGGRNTRKSRTGRSASRCRSSTWSAGAAGRLHVPALPGSGRAVAAGADRLRH